MEHKPLVSVVIPCYNQAIYLPDALDSLLKQSFHDWEAIIVNDGSPDKTKEVSLNYVEKDQRFKYIYKENGGLPAARNVGIKNAQGKYILPLDADDRIADTYIEKALKVFQDHPHTDLVYCQVSYFGNKEGRWNLSYKSYEELLMKNSIFCSAFYRKEDWIKIKGYDEKMVRGFEDWDFYIRLLGVEKTVYQIPEILFFYRIKEVSMLTESSKGDNWLNTFKYIYQKNKCRYTEVFGDEIQILRQLHYYKNKEGKRQSRWWRRLFKQMKKVLSNRNTLKL